MATITASELRQKQADTLNRVAYAKERVVVRRQGRDIAVLVPVEDAALLEKLEDSRDIRAARKALREAGSVSLKEARAALGL